MPKLKEPESMDELVYFTRRALAGGKGEAVAWVRKQACPKCKKAPMGKPIDSKGHKKIRAKEYVCPACKYTAEKEAYEDTLTAEINYKCPFCGNDDSIKVPSKRKKVQMIDEETGKKTVAEAIRFQCTKCGKNIDITKKMKGA